jgi:hypothetical protein
MLKKLSKIDYLLQIHSCGINFDATEMSLSLRSIDTVTAVFVLDTEEIRDKNLQYLIP